MRNNKASIPVVIFVIGVFVICIFAIGVFLIREDVEKRRFDYGLASISEIDFMFEDLKMSYALNGDNGFREELRKIGGHYPDYIIRNDGENLKITRIVLNTDVSYYAWAVQYIPFVGGQPAMVFAAERKISLTEITSRKV